MEGTAIRLFGKKIACPESRNVTNLQVFSTSTSTATAAVESSDGVHNQQGGCDLSRGLTMEEKNCLQDDKENRVQTEEEDQLREEKEEDGDRKTPMGDVADKALKKPDKILPCPRCNSMDTKFCYYNNYNVRQPRHFCKSCQRYWTAGGTMRNMPVGSGRRKNKNPASRCQYVTEAFHAAQIKVANASNGVENVSSNMLSFGSDSPDFNCGNKEKGDDCSSGSTVTTNSLVEKMQERNGFHSHVASIIPWSYNPWSCAIPIPAGPIYPSPYWNYIPWLPQTDSSILGKHSREGELMIPNGNEEPKKQKSSVLIPKTLRIDDPDEAAKSSIWTTLGIKNENVCTKGIFKAFESKAEEYKKHHDITTSPVLQANLAALSRSLSFQERA